MHVAPFVRRVRLACFSGRCRCGRPFVTLVEHWAVTLGLNPVTPGPATGTQA